MAAVPLHPEAHAFPFLPKDACLLCISIAGENARASSPTRQMSVIMKCKKKGGGGDVMLRLDLTGPPAVAAASASHGID